MSTKPQDSGTFDGTAHGLTALLLERDRLLFQVDQLITERDNFEALYLGSGGTKVTDDLLQSENTRLRDALQGLYDLRSEWMNASNKAGERFATGPTINRLEQAMIAARAALANRAA